MPRVLHLLSQRPQQTGSGVTLEALIAAGHARGWAQAAVVGVPASEPALVVGLEASAVFALRFETAALPFAVPGMSDTMPYSSSRFSALSAAELAAYRREFRTVVAAAIEAHRPDVIHSNHLWILSALARELAPEIPIAVHSHGTGLRQLDLCPHLADEIVSGVRTCDRFFALHRAHAAAIIERFAVPASAVTTVGAGYRADLFLANPVASARPASRVCYAGKLAAAKGVPPLIEAVDRLAARREVSLTLAGGGDNADATATRARAARSPNTRMAGRLDQVALAALLADSDVFVLPSFFEGLPLVLVEALACGARLVATDLPGVRELAASLGDRLEIVPMPRLVGPDKPHPDDVPAFVANLEAAIERALDAGRPPPLPLELLSPLSWTAVFERIERVWLELLA